MHTFPHWSLVIVDSQQKEVTVWDSATETAETALRELAGHTIELLSMLADGASCGIFVAAHMLESACHSSSQFLQSHVPAMRAALHRAITSRVQDGDTLRLAGALPPWAPLPHSGDVEAEAATAAVAPPTCHVEDDAAACASARGAWPVTPVPASYATRSQEEAGTRRAAAAAAPPIHHVDGNAAAHATAPESLWPANPEPGSFTSYFKRKFEAIRKLQSRPQLSVAVTTSAVDAAAMPSRLYRQVYARQLWNSRPALTKLS